jgi:hypothetical protein
VSSLTYEEKTRIGYRLRVYTAAGRRSIWLGKITQPEAVAVQRHVDEILAAQTADLPIPRQTAIWLDRLSMDLKSKLVCITGSIRTVRSAIDEYLHSKRDKLAASTVESVTRSLEILGDAIGTRRIDGVSAEEIASIYDALEVGESTKGKIAKDWKTLFNWCEDHRWILSNPAKRLSTAVRVREKHFVTIETAEKILAACADPELRLVVALSRFGGLRISSEIRDFTADSIDHTAKRIKINDTKRGVVREIPIFPELAKWLPAPGVEPLPTLSQLSHAGITARFNACVLKAGLETWDAPWHSMRASRETELIAAFGLATASKWIGNSEKVAMANYALVPDSDWAKAVL